MLKHESESTTGRARLLPSPDLSSTAEEATPVNRVKGASSDAPSINIPLNLENWKTLPAETQAELTWFHQYTLEQRLSLKQAADALNYDKTTLYRVFKGSYEGNWTSIAKAIQSFRKVAAERGDIQKVQFVQTSISKLVWGGLSYALANNSITLITGESRRGKSIAARAWRDANNHGRSVYVEAPEFGGTRRLLLDIATAVGHGKDHKSSFEIHNSILRAFNANRILIVDEAHRLLPNDGRANPVNLEILRALHGRTGCALALIATSRFTDQLTKGEYMFEQLLGRIGMPVRLYRDVSEPDVMLIVQQYIKRPGEKVMQEALKVANALGSFGILVEVLKVGSRLATKEKRPMTQEDFFKAIAIRRQMMGQTQFAKKD